MLNVQANLHNKPKAEATLSSATRNQEMPKAMA